LIRLWLSSTAAYELCSCSFGPRNACATTSTSVPRGLAVTLRLASRHVIDIWTERWKRIEWSTARIPSLTLDQERHVVRIIWNIRVPGRGIRKYEREHWSMVLAREEPVTPVKDGCWGILIDAYLGTWWWDNSAGLGRLYLQLAVVAVGRVDPGNRLKVSLADFEAEAAFVTFGNYPLEHAGFWQ